ncbi:MAG: CoA transferase [Chloroflexi bacterium]|nr:CoA transferase [Chloroflexota bacterium]
MSGEAGAVHASGRGRQRRGGAGWIAGREVRGEDEVIVGALDGVRVLEFSQVVAAPFCGMLLADMRADAMLASPFIKMQGALS